MVNGAPQHEDRSVLSRSSPEPTSAWRYGADSDQVADVYLPAGRPHSAVVLIHGGFWRPEYDRGHLRPMAEALRTAGHAVLSLEYRRTPGDPDVTLADLRWALATLAQRPPSGFPTALPTAVGHSAGGHLALVLASEPNNHLRQCVALAPVADLRLAEELRLDADAVPAFLGASASARIDMDPSRLPPPSGPVTVIHGASDTIVPIALSRAYVEAMGGRVTFHELAGMGHFELIDPQADAFRDLLTVIDRTGIE